MPKPVMLPSPGERLLRFTGDRLQFKLRANVDPVMATKWKAFLRTNLGRGAGVNAEIVHSHAGRLPLAGASWRDVALRRDGEEWEIDLAMIEPGYFKAKAYLVDPEGRQYWPDGPDVGVSVHPDAARTANILYCAFTRMFGPSKTAVTTIDPLRETEFARLDQAGYTVIPPSGKFRDVLRELPHIFEGLGCRILHLLPVSPTPTTFAKFGRFGSPYACEDLTGIDPALVEFDKRTTGLDQFQELTDAVHARGGRLFLDIVINHTGWGSVLQEQHPEWFVRNEDGKFHSPGAWGTVWEDLVELDHRKTDPWSYLAEVFLTWCRRGVDGFRCDAGYMVPMPAWRYITAVVRQQFPETIFLLEGLGGSWDATEALLTEGGMQWAYSELFQNFAGGQLSGYLDYALRQSERVGVYVHYSETHDNNRLAATGRAWSLHRNRLCALTSVSGGFGFTCGVEWLAAEKVNVHSSRGLSWGNPDNILHELSTLNRLLCTHPCFFDNARIQRISRPESPVLALRRDSGEGLDTVLILANPDLDHPQTLTLELKVWFELGRPGVELLGQHVLQFRENEVEVIIVLPPGFCGCLAPSIEPRGLSGNAYREIRALASWAWQVLGFLHPVESLGPCSWRLLAQMVRQSPFRFLASMRHLDSELAALDLPKALQLATAQSAYPKVVVWGLADAHRVTVVPHDHWLLIEDDAPFRATVRQTPSGPVRHIQSISAGTGHFASVEPSSLRGVAVVEMQRFAGGSQRHQARLHFPTPEVEARTAHWSVPNLTDPLNAPLALLTNGRGGMARMCVDLGRIKSKYDCLLAANLHPSVPVDRHVFAKRVRVWLNASRFITPLDAHNLAEFTPGPPARWKFAASAGDGRSVEITLEADMLEGRNTTVLRLHRTTHVPAPGRRLEPGLDVRLALRVDVEDRNFHSETTRSHGAETHFHSHTRPIQGGIGFEFTPASDRRLRVECSSGRYHPVPEWSEQVAHPVEQSRWQNGSGDAWSPGWFDVPMPEDGSVTLTLSADAAPPFATEVAEFTSRREQQERLAIEASGLTDRFGQRLAEAVQAFVVRRDQARSVIAGYPWFLDWGRDSLICARGLLAAGMTEAVRDLLVVFGRFENGGTLPNTIHGEDASNRDTSDAPLWYGVVAEELAGVVGDSIYALAVDERGKTIGEVLRNIANGYVGGTSNGIAMDAASGLVWSPSHFTWMDTNYPAGTPREGYPIEIQALWIRLLRQLHRLEDNTVSPGWLERADRATASLRGLFWIEERGFFADLLVAGRGTPAVAAVRDNALRSNCLLAVSLDVVRGVEAQRCVQEAARHLVVPGALRTLAPLPISPPLPIRAGDGRLLNDPERPYWGRYEGDEDTRRKPAYHNGTAWTWTFPSFCEALVKAWNQEPAAVAAAQAYLGTMADLLDVGCIGQLPEILDGDAPHQQRGCDAQAWGATEALRVWKLLQGLTK